MSEHIAIDLSIGGMSCAGCVAAVEKILQGVPGVSEATVNFASHTARVVGEVAEQTLIEAVVSGGYEAAVVRSLEEQQARRAEDERRRYRQSLRRALIAALVGVPLMVGSMAGLFPELVEGQPFWLLVGLLSGVAMVYSGRHYYSGAWKQLLHHNANMDTLIAIGTASAWAYSFAITLFPHAVPTLAHHAYFEAAVLILAFINFGQAMELRARGKSSQAIQRLVGLQPKTARVVREGVECDVAIAEIGLNETLRVRPGERIAVDGEVIEGSSYIDESMISGESIPQQKGIGSTVIGGTINGRGTLLYRSSHVGGDTVLAQIIDMVRRAQASRPAIGRLVDKVAGVFVPTVLLIALATLLMWLNFGPSPQTSYAIVATMSVLIIACPCALGLATPISIMVGVGKAAEFGVVIRNGDALQLAGKVSCVVLDKTGTITKGSPSLISLKGFSGDNEDDLLALAASLEVGSEHPLAQAIIEAADERGLERLKVSEFESLSGRGVKGVIGTQQVLLGNHKLMNDHGVHLGHLVDDAAVLAKQGQTPVYMALNESGAALLAIADPLKEESASAVKRLQRLGIKVVMLTGDNRDTAAAVAAQVGVDSFMAELSPGEKAEAIEQLQGQGEIVAMVGDGINDAPSLARSEVGFAIGSGTDIAIESADVTLMGNSLHGVVDAVCLSRATVRNIKQNLFGAFLYNTLGIPLAAGVLFPLFGWLLNPMFAGAAMALSSLTVVSNANRLRLFRAGAGEDSR